MPLPVPLGERRPVAQAQIVELLGRIAGAGLEFVKTENLQTFDGEKGFSLGQGE